MVDETDHYYNIILQGNATAFVDTSARRVESLPEPHRSHVCRSSGQYLGRVRVRPGAPGVRARRAAVAVAAVAFAGPPRVRPRRAGPRARPRRGRGHAVAAAGRVRGAARRLPAQDGEEGRAARLCCRGSGRRGRRGQCSAVLCSAVCCPVPCVDVAMDALSPAHAAHTDKMCGGGGGGGGGVSPHPRPPCDAARRPLAASHSRVAPAPSAAHARLCASTLAVGDPPARRPPAIGA